MNPGSNVIFELRKKSILIEKPIENVAEIFEKIAKSGKRADIKPGEAYEKEIEHRWEKLKIGE